MPGKKVVNKNNLIHLLPPQQIADLLDIRLGDVTSWIDGHDDPNSAQLGVVLLTLLKQNKITLNSDSVVPAPTALSLNIMRAKHLNETLFENAMGKDATIHEILDECLANAMDIAKKYNNKETLCA